MNQVSNERRPNPVAELSTFMSRLKGQMTLALPKHMNADRMTRLALTAFSTNPDLQLCTHESIAGSIMVAAQMGLEPGVNGQGYLIPYKGRCTFVPGWKGIVDIANRSGRSSVWTGAVFVGDEFDYAMGDRPFITHKPGRSLGNADDLLYVYAVGRVRDSEWPIIEVWSMEKVWAHRDQYNKVGKRHYSFENPEMYARKVPLLQVLKYMPSSIELAVALDVSNATESGKGVVLDGNFVTVSNDPDPSDVQVGDGAAAPVVRSKSEAARAAAPATSQTMPPASAASDPETGEIKSPTAAQVKFLKQKIDAIQLPESAVTALLVRIGAASLEALTFEQYDQVRAELLALE